MDKFKELQEQHQVTPKEENPFLTDKANLDEPLLDTVKPEGEAADPDQSPVLPQTLEPEVVDNLPESLPSEDEGQE